MSYYVRGTKIEVEGYIQVEPTWRSRLSQGDKVLDGISIERITKRPPEHPLPGSVTVRVKLRFPSDVFYPLMPRAVIDVSPAAVRQNPIEVEAIEEGVESGDGDA